MSAPNSREIEEHKPITMIYEKVGTWIADAEIRDEHGGTGKETAKIIGSEVIDYVLDLVQTHHQELQKALTKKDAWWQKHEQEMYESLEEAHKELLQKAREFCIHPTMVAKQIREARHEAQERCKDVIKEQIEALKARNLGSDYYLEGLKMEIHLIYLEQPDQSELDQPNK